MREIIYQINSILRVQHVTKSPRLCLSVQLLPSEGVWVWGAQANHIPHPTHLLLSSSLHVLFHYSHKSPLCSPCCLAVRTSASFNLSTHTEKHFWCFAGSSVVLGDGCGSGCEWVDTYRWRDSEHIHSLSLSGSISKKTPTHSVALMSSFLILSVLVTEKLNIFSSACCLLLSAAVSKPDNLAASTTVTILKGSLSW